MTDAVKLLPIIETARRFANGEATCEELDAVWAAARDAAWAAARDAAWAAARDAAWAAAGDAALEARVAALEAELDGLAEDAELHRKRAYTLGLAYLDEVVDDEAPRPSKQYTFEETVLIARAAVAALHPTSEAEL